MSRLFLVRHGESAWNAEGRLQGQAQAPLSDRGRDQARALRLPQLPAVSSDLERAVETAALAGFPDAPTDARWRERYDAVGTEEWARGGPASQPSPAAAEAYELARELTLA